MRPSASKLIALLVLTLLAACNRSKAGWSGINSQGLEPRAKYVSGTDDSCWLEIEAGDDGPYARLATTNRHVVAQLLAQPYLYLVREMEAPLKFKLTSLQGNQVWRTSPGFVRQLAACLQSDKQLKLYLHSGAECISVDAENFPSIWEMFQGHHRD